MATQQALAKVESKQKLEMQLRSPQMMRALIDVLPRHVDADWFTRKALMALSKNPALCNCRQDSFLIALMRSAELGLDPGGALGSAYLIPFKDECVFIPGYQGLIDLALRSGKIDFISAELVYEKDEFDYDLGSEPRVTFKKFLGGNRGAERCAFAFARFKDGPPKIEVLTLGDIEHIKSKSRAAASGPWVTDREQMIRKSAVRRLAKFLKLSPEFDRALELEDEAEARVVQAESVEPRKAATPDDRAARMLQKVDEAFGKAEPAAEPSIEVPPWDGPTKSPATTPTAPIGDTLPGM